MCTLLKYILCAGCSLATMAITCVAQPGLVQDTLYIDSLSQRAAALLEEDKPDSAILLYKKAAAAAGVLGQYYRQTDNMYEQGNAWLAAQQPDSARYYFSWAYKNTLKHNDLNLYAYAYNSLLDLHTNQGEVSAALSLIAEADSLLPALMGNPINLAMAYGNTGVFFSNKGLQERGLDYYLKALDAIKSINDSMRIYPMLINIASTFSTLENEAKAYQYVLEAKKYIHPENLRFIGMFNLQAGLIDERFKKYDSAAARLQRASAILGELGRVYEQGTALAGLGRVLALQGQISKAIPVFDEAQKLAEKANIPMLKARVLYSRGRAYYEAKDWPNAALWLQRSYDVSMQTQQTTVLEDVTKYLAEAYAQTGNFKQALAMQQEYTAIRDSIVGVRTLFSTAEAEARFQNELLKEQSLVKDLTISNQARTMVILVLLAVAVAGAGFFFTYRTRQRKKLEAAHMRNKIAADLHDEVGSTLSSIGMMTDVLAYRLKDADAGAVETLQKVSANARQTMESMDEIIWTINPQQDAFANLETRLKHFAYPLLEARGVQSTFDFEPELQQVKLAMEQRQHIYLVLKEAINNALKYSEATHLEVRGSRQASSLTFAVKDNGKGFEPGTAGKQRNGLGNMQKRADLLHGKLTIDTAPGQGTQVQLQVPMG